MSLPIVFGSVENIMMGIQVQEILETNGESQKFGLVLSEEDALQIIEERREILKNYGRVEIDIGVTKKLVNIFCGSPFISQQDYVSIINELHELFYYIKNETMDKLGDDELIDLMKECFDNHCSGSVELLNGRELEGFARKFREQYMPELYFKGEE